GVPKASGSRLAWLFPAPHPTLPHKGGGLFWLPPPLCIGIYTTFKESRGSRVLFEATVFPQGDEGVGNLLPSPQRGEGPGVRGSGVPALAHAPHPNPLPVGAREPEIGSARRYECPLWGRAFLPLPLAGEGFSFSLPPCGGGPG